MWGRSKAQPTPARGGGAGTTLTLDRIAPDSRLACWSSYLDSEVLPGTVGLPDCGMLTGRVETRRSPGGLRLVHVQSVPQTVDHDHDDVSAADDDFFLLTLQIEGQAQVRQGDRSFRLVARDLSLRDANKPSTISFSTPFRELVMHVPKSAVAHRRLFRRPVSTLRMPGTSGLGAVASDLLFSVAQHFDELDGTALRTIEHNLFELVGAALAEAQGPRYNLSTAVRNATLARILDWISAHLGDPELSPTLVAEENGISVRYLHSLFNETGSTFNRYVIERRLARCYRDLMNPRLAPYSITEICLRWGFSDPAHFSKVFGRHFGLTPREHRRRHLARNGGDGGAAEG